MENQNKSQPAESNHAPEAANNVIQFPTRKKEETVEKSSPVGPAPKGDKATTAPVPAKGSKKNAAAGVLAIMLMTIAVNKFTFSEKQTEKADLASLSSGSGRRIASVDRGTYTRDAQWEKSLADSLASAQVRDVASVGVGRSATKEENLRWGVLEEKYTITFSKDDHVINSILLQDASSSPAYILDRSQFLRDYGLLLETSFETAKLTSVEKSADKTIESYTLFNKDNKPKGEARFELDRHKRLLSLKVAPIQI